MGHRDAISFLRRHGSGLSRGSITAGPG
jgi:hypothetical protein